MKPAKPTYSNDRTAPRMRKAEFITNIVTRKLWEDFRKSSPEYKDITWKEFHSKWEEIAETIRSEMVNNELGVKLGAYTGELKLQYLPHKFEAADLTKVDELKEKVSHLNLVSRGKVAKIKWERRWAVKFNKMLQFFAFEGTRDINTQAKKRIDEHPEKLRVARNTLGGHSIWRQLGK